MAKKLKCWRKLGKHEKGFKNWEHKEKGDVVVFLESVNPKKPFRVSVHRSTKGISARTILDKKFNKRKSAENFAKSYMKKHNVC